MATEDRNPTLEELGFESEEEFHRLVAELDLSTSIKINEFKRWQSEDGSKTGLLELDKN